VTWPFGDLQPGAYRALVVDPPWEFKAGTKGRPQHYARMTDLQIARLPIDELAHPEGCWLFVWTTSPRLHLTFDIARSWGFRYSSRAFIWVKTERGSNPLFAYRDGLHTGMGFTTRKNAEDLLLFRRGSPKRLAADVHEIIFSPVREHSRKPEESYELIERFCAGPYAELFSRTSRPHWAAWGLEAGKFDEAAP
jgi:N6-adenosine-specific RNA methylase IME4